MKIHPVRLSWEEENILKSEFSLSKAKVGGVLEWLSLTLKEFVEKDKKSGKLKLAHLWEIAEKIAFMEAKNHRQWSLINEEYFLKSVGKSIGKMRYDSMYVEIERLERLASVDLFELKIAIKAMYILSKPYMTEEFKITPPQI
jgi:hypothetical protein